MFIVPTTRSTSTLSRRLDRHFLDSAFDRFLADTVAAPAETSRAPTLDVSETDAGYVARLDVPGVAKDAVQVSIEGRRVAIQAQVAGVGAEKPEAEARVIHRERSEQTYARTFTLPVAIDSAAAVAKLENGVLTLTLPKLGATAPTTIAVN